jgi:hypothetical protein
MSDTTTITGLSRINPRSETHWRQIAARAHRLRSEAGDESAALTHEVFIREIRSAKAAGSSRKARCCPRCLKKGSRYLLIFVAGTDRCGTCGWPDDTPKA